MNLHDLTEDEQQKLADLIHAWLDENTDIVDEHERCFDGGIHNTNNFLPWHRVHIQILEDYIRDNAIAADFPNIPEINDERFRLPMWRPETIPAAGDKIPTPFQITASGAPVDHPVFGPMNFNPPLINGMSQFLDDLDDCTTQFTPPNSPVDAGEFSNDLELRYHNNGHIGMSGIMVSPRAPDCLIFWPWHAWVDDLWYYWESHCRGEYDLPFGASEIISQTVTTISPPGTTWTGEMFVKGEVVVSSGATLTIGQNAIIHFRDSRYNSFPTRIIVEPGGTLIVDGATLTGIDVFGNWAPPAPPPPELPEAGGAKYYAAWEGIIVRSSDLHIKLEGAHGLWKNFLYCTINNLYQDPHGHYISRGVVAGNSQYFLYGCGIKNQVIGISGRNALAGPGRNATVRSSSFENNFEGITLLGVDNSEISTNNTFIVPDEIPSGVVPDGILSDIGLPFGIYSDGSAALTVADNGFSTAGANAVSVNNYGAILANTASDVILPFPYSTASVEKRNHFNGVGIGSQAQGSNGNLQIRCNDYDAFQFGIAVTSGLLPTQGQCPFFPNPKYTAGNTWDNIGCNDPDDESQIFLENGATPFTYWANLNQLPTCYTDLLNVLPCNTNATSTSCDDPIIPCPRCEESRIAALETEKNTLPPNDEQIQFITHEQQLIYQEGVNERLENENEGLDVAITFTQNVEAITSLWPGNKAALLLLKSEREGSIVSGTTTAISAISESDPTKKWFNLRYDLLTSGRTYSQLTSTEKAVVEAEAEQHTKSGAHAKAILEMAYGIPAQPHIEPVNQERNAKQNPAASQSSGLNIVPNPVQEMAQIFFTAPETQHQSWLILTDLNGRLYYQIDLADLFGESQIPLSTADLPAGIYLLHLQMEGQPSEVKKLTVIR